MEEPPRDVSPPQEEPISQWGQGGTARLMLPEEPACLNPYRAACRGAETLSGLVLEAPLMAGPSTRYRPLLAEAVPSFGGGTLGLAPFTVEFRLREDARFSDGGSLTSADAGWTYEQAVRLAETGEIAPLYAGFSRVSRIETPDARTVRLVFDGPYAHWQDLLTAPVLPRHIHEDRGLLDLDLDDEPVGSGPFVLQGGAEGALDFVESGEYWVEEPPLPNLEGVEVRFPEDPETAAEDLASGHADFGFFAAGPAPDSGDLLRAAAAPVRVELMLFNARRLEDREARAVISRAVDREGIAGTLGAPVARSFVPPEFVPGYVPAWKEPPEDRAETRAGQQLSRQTLELVYPEGSPARGRVASTLAENLSAAGIEVEARVVPPEEFFGEVLPDGAFDLALFTGGAPVEHGALVPNLPPEAGEKLVRGSEALDGEDRARLLAEAQNVLADQNALLPLFVWPDTFAWSSGLRGPRPETPYRGLMWNIRDWAFYK